MLRIYLLNYNYGRYVGEAVESLLAQTDRDFAVTCIDNGSSDGSADFLRDQCEQHGWDFAQFPNLSVSKIGNYVARNFAEDYIVRLDADDVFCPNYVEWVKAAIASENADIVYGDYHLVDFDSRVFSSQQILKRGKNDNRPIHDEPFHGACTVIKRERLLDHGGYYEQFSRNDGYDLYLKFRKDRLVHLAKPLFHYRRGHRSMSTNRAMLFETRVKMIAAYASEHNLTVGPEVVHVLAFPDHPDYYSDGRLERYHDFARSWGRSVKLLVRDEAATDSECLRWSQVQAYDDLRQYLDEDAAFADAETFIVHSMSNRLAPLEFFEMAPIAMQLFESEAVITGEKLESSLYWTTSGGVRRQENSRKLFEEDRAVVHSGGLTGFVRGSPRDTLATLLEISSNMTVEGHC